MENAPIVWLSVDPVRRKVDFYPKELAKRIEKVYQDYYVLKISDVTECVLGKDFFNATINLQFNNSFYQTTPGSYFGPRGGSKQPGYRSVKRVIVPENKYVEIFAHTVHGEWRITNSEIQAIVKFMEKIPTENMFYISEISKESKESEESDAKYMSLSRSAGEVREESSDILTYWKPEDFENENNENNELLNKNVVVWQWCFGVKERQGNLINLDDKWWKPYLFEQNKIIEEAFNNRLISAKITIPFDNSVRNIVFYGDSCFATQKNETGTRIRTIRRNIITIKKLIELLENENKKPIDISKLLNNIDENEIPHEFYCSISQDIMTDPVKTIDGFTYDRVSIEKWFENSCKSPLTGLNLSSKTLTPNNELRKQIEEFLKKNIN